ncbi:unnamed protein product [Clonostachys rhizophaga]|uniref:Unsaturated glucuronyl hydrolase n=1 Tax=Clonostachys rhizophaga TaxID=160324 RepID=A0A9N9VPG7_9HYPO|nr:unnamed protein product [Clonostachys rhizophaga]
MQNNNSNDAASFNTQHEVPVASNALGDSIQANPHDSQQHASDTPDVEQPKTPPYDRESFRREQPHLNILSPTDSPRTQPPGSDGSCEADNQSLNSPLTEPNPSTEDGTVFNEGITISTELADLYAENILAKVYRTACRSMIGERRFPDYFPEYVPQDGSDAGSYTLREAEFWTCGFFPGTLYSLLERAIRFPAHLRSPNITSSQQPNGINVQTIRLNLHALCDTWSRPLHEMTGRTDTHDIGFIVMPALRLDWELMGNSRSLDSIIQAAKSLATRYVPTSGAIRSWDLLLKKNLEIRDQTENMILIIDSLCNLDLLYYAASHMADGKELYDIATSHARVLLRTHLRKEPPMSLDSQSYKGAWYSTCHVANIDPRNGELKARLTHQGYDNESTWARGQSWGILGYAQTYMSTKDDEFLWAACGLAEYFLHRLKTAPDCVPQGTRLVPLWDFDAPIDDRSNPLRDSSAGAIAANGMLVLSQGLAAAGQDKLSIRYRRAAVDIVHELLYFAQAPEKARLVGGCTSAITVEDETAQTFDGILKFGTANNNQYSKKQYSNHGLVYGDYYLVEFGNRLLRMGLV